jgi:fructose-1,6-bisphosphatase/inositol monophosphatase family enzyme
MAAQGSLAFAIDVDLRIWDYAAAELLVREAGGAFEIINEYKDDEGNQKFNVLMGRTALVEKYLPKLQKLFV